jgi:hypothetical protein
VTRRKPRLSVEVSIEEIDLYKVWAKQQGMTVSDWVRKELERSVPSSVRDRLRAGMRAAEAVEEAYRLLDREDSILQPKRMKLPVLSLAKDHRCRHYKPELPLNYRPGQCQGSCMHPRRGMACFVPSQQAHNCGEFSPKKLL